MIIRTLKKRIGAINKSLTAKMFLLVFTTIIIVITILVGSLIIYFGYFYRDNKIDQIISNINAFSEDYSKENWSQDELYGQINVFNNNNNGYLDVYSDSYGGVISNSQTTEPYFDYLGDFSQIYTVSLQSSGDESLTYYMTLYEQDYQETFVADEITNIDVINLEGYLEFGELITPKSINGITLTSFDEFYDESYFVEGSYVNDNFIVLSVDYFNLAASYDESEEAFPLEKEPDESYYSTKEVNGVSYYMTDIPFTNYRQINFYKSVLLEDRIYEMYFNVSLHSVNEVINTILSSIPFITLIVVIFALIVAIIYSKTVSKPIIELTKTADRMANMELNIRADINGDDELGVLSKSLNTLALNLDNAMDLLKIKNIQLEKDVKRKVMEEESRKAFVANASHELKTPLGIIKSYSEAISDGVKADKKDYYEQVISDEIEHMDKLIQEMLQLSKIDALGIDLNINKFDLDELTKSAISHYNSKIKERKLKIIVKEKLPVLSGDESKINQVMMNLIANAVKYADEDSVIYIEAINKNDKVGIYINNVCETFTQEDLTKVWERFYKIDVSHNKAVEGNGLGLAIVKSILDAHHAEFGVYNTSKGVCFYFVL